MVGVLPRRIGYCGFMVLRALVHGMFVALVVLLAIVQPDLRDRPEPPWLDEVCAHYDACESGASRESSLDRD